MTEITSISSSHATTMIYVTTPDRFKSPYYITNYLINIDEFSHFDAQNLSLVAVTHIESDRN